MARWRTSAGSISWTYVTLKSWNTISVYYALCGKLIPRPSIMGGTFAVSKTRSTDSTQRCMQCMQTLVGVNWSLRGNNGAIRAIFRFGGLYSFKIIGLPPSKTYDFHTPVPKGWYSNSNRAFRALTLILFSYSVNYIRTSSSRVREYLGGMTEVEKESTTLVAFIRTVRHWVVNRLARDDMICIFGNDGLLICVS